MRRRDVLKSVGAVAACAAWPGGGEATTGAPGVTLVEVETVRLYLRHTWTTVMSSSEYRDTVHVRLSRDGVTGIGEGAPIVRYKESAESARRAIETVAGALRGLDPLQFHRFQAELFKLVEGEWAAKAAIDIAVFDWVGKRLGVPVYRLFGLDPADAPLTTFSIGIDTPEMTRQKVAEAADFPMLKIKVGLDSDEATMAAVRAVTDKPLLVDANEGWKDRQLALERIKWLETQNVRYIEQPMPASMFEEQKWLRERVSMPIFADEACLRVTDIPRLAEAYDGINVKLDKAGGILEAFRMITVARSLGLRVMLGCMISSSVSITAAAHLSPLVDFADLDGNLLIANDPYAGVTVHQGKLVLPAAPGLGLTPRRA